ncbi:MAG TPA: hypothetical protein VK053_13755 [Jiangellaceae bacterium]|nr:hypothetical protein [Jiangellaceae bacterium]
MSVAISGERTDLEARRTQLLDRLGIDGAEYRLRGVSRERTSDEVLALEELDEIDCLLTEDVRV